jgi:hypothetical protein
MSNIASQVAITGVKVLPKDSAVAQYFLFLKFLFAARIIISDHFKENVQKQ